MGQFRVITEFFPDLEVVEDEDGHRILSVPETRFPSWVAEEAINLGVVAVLVSEVHFALHPTEDGVLLARFGGTEVEVNPDCIRESPTELPSYQEMLEAIRQPTGGFVHLHAHSEFSALDGYSKVEEMVAAAVADGQTAMAITDHGVCAGHPHFQNACDKAGIKPIFGIEAYLVDDRFNRDDQDYYHLILLAETDTGLRNLWAMTTEANRDGFYGKPRMDWDTLARHSEGVIATTACLRGPICHALRTEEYGHDVALSNIARLKGIFGTRLYVELGTNGLADQVKVNQTLVDLARQYDLNIVAAVDSHYPCCDDQAAHKVWLARYEKKTKDGVEEDTGLFAGDAPHHVMTAEEVRKALLDHLPPNVVTEAMQNTVNIAESCTARMPAQAEAPVFSRKGGAAADVERLVRICLEHWSKTLGKRHGQDVYEARFEREMKLLIDKGFCGYYLMVHDQVDYAKRNGILVGPGRGSGSGSLVAYLCGITEIDPVEVGLLFERFLTEGRKALPDFDVDYPSSAKDRMAQYAVERWGEDRVIRVGTHIRLKNKGVVRALTKVLEKEINDARLWPDMEMVSKLITDIEASTAGLGMPWDEMWAEHGEALDPYRQKYPLLFAYADKMVGRLNAYGRHAAGFVISTEEALTDRLPLWVAGDGGQRVVEFDMNALEAMGLIKFDLLNIRNLDTIQMAVDLIREQCGVEINVYDWKAEYDDPILWEEIAKGHTRGIFQIETGPGTKIAREFQPRSLRELADTITLVRPGPTRSGLRAMYLRRRDGLEPVSYPDPRLEEFLSDTFGCILYQEQIMQTCMVMGGYSSEEADEVRKILGKKKVALIAEAGEQFVSRCVQNGLDHNAVLALWDQMKEFAKYSFNRSHAWAYAMLGVWTGWLKFHYPAQFFTALLSTEEKAELPAVIKDARRMGLTILPPDINESGVGFRNTPQGIRYGLDAIKGVGSAAVEAIVAGQPYTSWEDYLERKGRNAHSGVTKLLVKVGAFDSLVPNRRALEAQIEWDTSKESNLCALRDERVLGPNGLPCTFDWSTEPVPVGKSGRPLKPKPLPKRCSRACRQFVERSPETGHTPYTQADIRDIERDLLGTYLSSTPFDRVPEDVREQCATSEDVAEGPSGGEYLVATILVKKRPIKDRHGRDMGFLTLEDRHGELDVTVFGDEWGKYSRDFREGHLCFALVRKNDRGLTLKMFQPV